MKSPADFAMSCFCRGAASLLLASALTPAFAQQAQSNGGRGVVEDWTSHHVVFSDPGTLMNAIMNGKRERWEKITNDPRYQMQQIRRNAGVSANAATAAPRFSTSSEASPVFSRLGHNRFRENEDRQTLEGAWTVALGSPGSSPALGMYPAKYTFSPIGAPACSDFVVFPEAIAGSNFSQANIAGVNNLYVGPCLATGTTSNTILWSYFVGPGEVQTSPSISLDGSKVAFVESNTTANGGSRLHVLTIGTTGTNKSGVEPCTINGTANPSCVNNSDPANNAVDNYVVLNGTVMVTRSSAFIDYGHDIAYVGDDTGKLHKITPVFTSGSTSNLPAEVTTGGWPVTVTGSTVVLTGPTYDPVSGNVFVGGSDGNLYCVSTSGTTAALCSTPSVAVGSGGTGGGIIDAPLVDSTNQTVFTEANNFTSGDAVLSQVTTSMGGQVKVNMGFASTGSFTDLYTGDFDNTYYTSLPGAVSGHLYFCGNQGSAATPELERVTFTAAGTLVGVDTSTTSLPIQLTSSTGTAEDCTPLTEVYNAGANAGAGFDFLFVGVKNNGNPSGCKSTTCVISFDLGQNVVLAASATLSAGGGVGTSAIIIDNVSTSTGGSQIYFGSPNAGAGEQESQSALQ
jgi:hypothetical protein